jgi:hypothetical protein
MTFPGFSSAYEQATGECRGVASITASLGLSGRAGANRLGGRIDTGLAAPARIRLEMFPPMSFGRAAFLLVADEAETTLFLPRENRVLRGARPEEIVETLTGVPLGGADLRTLLTGCGLSGPAPSEGRVYENGWAAADAAGTTTYFRQMDGRWRVAGAARGAMVAQYGDFDKATGRPRTINVRTTPPPGGPATNLTVKLSDVEIGVPLGEEVFEVAVPPDAVPLTLDELRRGRSEGAPLE